MYLFARVAGCKDLLVTYRRKLVSLRDLRDRDELIVYICVEKALDIISSLVLVENIFESMNTIFVGSGTNTKRILCTADDELSVEPGESTR